MTMGKSLLLGTAAGLVTIAGAQAADLAGEGQAGRVREDLQPVRCGFYYIPGTDMCIKIGGWVRAEYGWGSNGNFDLGLGERQRQQPLRPTTATSVPAVTSRPMPATRPNTARCAVTSRSA